MKKYSDLNSLLRDDEIAAGYYNTLPDYVQELMQQRADSVNSFESMCDYAENLTRGDN